MKKNILIISIYYPPIESIASNRIYSFAKYLDKNKFNIFVHTVDTKAKYNNNLVGVKISRVENNPLFKAMTFEKRTNKIIHYLKVVYNKTLNKFIDDPYTSWVKKSKQKLEKLIKENNIDCIISSFAPIASHKLALELKKEFPKIKWIADMRDEMSASPFIDTKTKNIYTNLEKEIFKYADAITSVSKPIVDEFRELSKNNKLKFKEIRNGYDFDINNRMPKNSIFTISYVGNFYGEINPKNFLQALSDLVGSKEIDNILVKFIGVKTHFDIPSNLKNSIKIIPPVSHKEAVEYMKSSDALLLIHPNNGRKGVFTGKLFEYMATLNPIIALVDTQDVAAKLIEEANCGYVAKSNSIEEIKVAILKAYNGYKSGARLDVNLDIIKLHHRREQAKRLEKLILELIDE